MKKFIILLILLLIVSGTAAYFGWVRLPENSQAVLYSKITGYEDKAVQSGSFIWRWQKLIPRTFKIHIFDNTVHSTNIVTEGKMPSGDVYSAILPGNPDFSYRISFSVKYRINSSMLPDLLKTGNILSENLAEWYSEKDTTLESAGKNFINSLKGSTAGLSSSSELEKKLSEFLVSRAADITFTSVTLNDFNIPDIDLYSEAKRQYLIITKNRENLVLESESKSAMESADLARQLELLEKYGELLTKYPILLEYIKINPEMDILKEKIGISQE